MFQSIICNRETHLLSAEYLSALGVIKMSDYLITGTKQQFWEEHFVKVIMQVSVMDN